jgi:small subunit ribosomal protein S1
VEVDINGLRAFAPASGMDLHPANANFVGLVGQRLEFKVIQYEKQGRDVVVTRRPLLEQEAHEKRKQALSVLEAGAEMEGVVRTVVEWGAFLALPGAENLEGLLHASEASHDPRARLVDLVKPGDRFAIKITKIDDKGKIWLSRKALLPDPWAEAKEKYAPGAKHTGKVARVETFGVFVALDDDLDGLIHVSDLSFKRVEHPSEVVKVGDEIKVVVQHFDFKHKKIALHPALPDDEPPQRVSRGAHIQAEVVKANEKGVEMRILGVTGRGARGFLPPGQTGTQRGTDLRKVFKAGQRHDVKVIDLDPRRGEPKLSLRAHKEDEERSAHRDYQKKMKSEANFGTLGDLLKQKFGGG